MQRPPAYDRLLDALQKLPGIGKRSAERIALYLLRQPPEEVGTLIDALNHLRGGTSGGGGLVVCSVTGMVSDVDPCWIVTDASRDHGLVLVVEQPGDVYAMEQSGVYKGSYHVLMGRVAPLDAVSPGDLNIASLIERIDKGRDDKQPDWPSIREVILGTNPTLEGDGTAMYLADKLADRGVKVTRLARGLPVGQNLSQVSKAVLSDALQGRMSTSTT
jgi:recombination protein RecR